MKNGIRTFTCFGCGITVTKSCVKSAKFCNEGCFHKNGKKGREKQGTEKECIICGGVFYVTKVRAGKAITCSVDCANEYQGRNKVEIACENCHNKFKVSPSFLNHGNPKYCSMDCRNKSESFKKRLIEMNAIQNNNNPNKFEKLAYRTLDELEIEFIPQYIINGKFTVDAFIKAKNLVLQFDGDYWHGNPKFYTTLDKRQVKRKALDISQDAYLKSCGISVFRFWQSDFSDIEAVRDKISELVK